MLFSEQMVYSQCGCPGNSSTFGTVPLSELSNVNSFIGDNLFVSLNNSYGYADTYVVRDTPIGQGFIKDYQSNFLNVRVGYKPISKLIVETEVGYFIKKKMNDEINF